MTRPVVLKWFHSDGEADVDDAVAVLAAHRAGEVTVSILDLTLNELGNVLLRALGWRDADVADQLEDIEAISPPVAPTAGERRAAAVLAEAHSLTFYDAIYAGIASSRGAALVTADGCASRRRPR